MDVYLYDTGDFKHRIEIQQAEEKKINGRPVNSWVTVLKTRAKTFKNNKTSTDEEQEGDTDKSTKRIVIRTPKSFELNNDYRVIYKHNVYKIKSTNDIKDSGVYTEIVIERLL